MKTIKELKEGLEYGTYDGFVKSLALDIGGKMDPSGRSGYETEDLMQEGYVKILELVAEDRYEENGHNGASLKTFLYRSVRNRLIDVEKRSQKNPLNISSDIGSVLPIVKIDDQTIEESERPVDLLLSEMSLRALCEELEKTCAKEGMFPKLGPPSAETIYTVLQMIAMRRTSKQIEETTGLSANMVRRLRHNIFELLRERMPEETRETLRGYRPCL